VLVESLQPRPARPREVDGVAAQHLDFEVRLEAEHHLAHVRADGLGIQRQHTVPERAATERRIGEGGIFAKRRATLPFNGYADEVASLYAGMDLKANF
jgi:hypothetical protein